jgi:hypothetical protein
MASLFPQADNDGKLPGPLWPGQLAQLDPARSGRLVRELATYLGIPAPAAPKVEPLFVPPAYRKAGECFVLGNSPHLCAEHERPRW